MKTIYAILAIFTFFSCAKDGGGFLGMGEGGVTTVEGKVTEKGSGKAVAGAEVLLKSQSEGSTMAFFRTDTTIITDNDGNYSITFSADKERDYEIQPKHELYNNIESYKSISTGRKNNIDLELEPWAWVKVHIINEPPLDTVRDITINGFHNISGWFTGIYNDISYIGKATGNTNWKFKIRVYTEKDTFLKNVEIFCPSHDTIDYYFKY